jgi:hypothetical protein
MLQEHRTRTTGVCLACAIAALLLGCTGEIIGGDGPSSSEGTTPGGTAGPGSPGSGGPGTPGADPGTTTGSLAPGPTLRLLTNSQYIATMRSLFPFADELTYDLEADIALSGFTSIGAATVALSAKATETYLKIAEAAAARAFADEASATAFIGCAPADSACASGFVQSFGRRAFRRSLSSEEQTRYVGLYTTGIEKLGDATAALEHVTTAILASPYFLYRVELGEPNAASPTGRALTGVEVASKLAYLLWDGPPDTALLDLGEGNSLGTADAVRQQAERLLSSAEFAAGMENLFDDYLKLSRLDAVEKLESAFPAFSPSLLSAMRQETLLGFQRVVDEGLDFRTLFNGTSSFVNAELADLYGVDGVSGTDFVQVELPAATGRRGLLGQASILSLYSHPSTTSPTLRGKFVRETLLCQIIAPPPDDVDTSLPDLSEAQTTRERFSLHAQDPGCAGCHQYMDPIGLGLENFDGIGAYRSEENGEPIDASGELDGTAFTGPAGLADALAVHSDVPECFARSVFRYGWGRLEAGSDEALIATLTAAFSQTSFKVRELMLSAVAAPEFQQVQELD